MSDNKYIHKFDNSTDSAALYKGLKTFGISDAEMDVGYGSSGTVRESLCEKFDGNSLCRVGASDGVIEGPEIWEYAVSNYEKYQKLIEGVTKQPFPWALDDLNAETSFDEKIRQRVDAAIALIKADILSSGEQEGTVTFQEKLATGLYYLSALPPTSVRETMLQAYHEGFDAFTIELKNIGLHQFRESLRATGGMRTATDYTHEDSVLRALELNRGKCTESSSRLYALFRRAGLNAEFIEVSNMELKETFANNRKINEYLSALPETGFHMSLGLTLGEDFRIYDPSLLTSDAQYKKYDRLALHQKLSDYLYAQGTASKSDDDVSGRIYNFSLAIEIDPTNYRAYNNRGLLYDDIHMYNDAITDYSKAIEIKPDYPFAFYNRGNTWSSLSEIDKAIFDYDTAIGINPLYTKAYSSRSVAKLKSGQVDLALQDCQKAIETAPNFYEAYNVCGRASEADGKIEQAKLYYDKAIAINPKYADAYANRGNLFFQMHDPNKALEDFESAITYNPTTSLNVTYMNRGYAKAQLGDLDGALKDFNKSIELNPKYSLVYDNRAVVYYTRGDFASAIADLKLCIDLDPKNYSAYFKLGRSYAALGDFQNTITAFSTILSVADPSQIQQISDGLVEPLFTYWGAEPQLSQAINFKAQSHGLDIVTVSLSFIMSYGLWLANQKTQAIDLLSARVAELNTLSAVSEDMAKFYLKMLSLMPSTMRLDPAASPITEIMTNKIGTPAK